MVEIWGNMGVLWGNMGVCVGIVQKGKEVMWYGGNDDVIGV